MRANANIHIVNIVNISAHVEGRLASACQGHVGGIGIAVCPTVGKDDTGLWWTVELYLMIGHDGACTTIGVNHNTIIQSNDHVARRAHGIF